MNNLQIFYFLYKVRNFYVIENLKNFIHNCLCYYDCKYSYTMQHLKLLKAEGRSLSF